MKYFAFGVTAFVTALFLTGCADHTPTKQGGTQYSTLVSEDTGNRVYESINIQYWSDQSDNPVVVLISFSSRPDARLIGWEHSFTDGKYTFIKIDDGTSKRDIPLFEADLLEALEVPVYYAIEKPGVTKTAITFNEFSSLKTAVDKKAFAEAKRIVTKRAEQKR